MDKGLDEGSIQFKIFLERTALSPSLAEVIVWTQIQDIRLRIHRSSVLSGDDISDKFEKQNKMRSSCPHEVPR